MGFDANAIELFKFVSREVHPNDEMFLTTKSMMPGPGEAFHYYFYSGGLVSTRLKEYLISHGALPNQMSILDFACGYGRFTRYFTQIFGEVVASDLEDTMLDFVQHKFGVRTFRSVVDTNNFKYPSQLFDIVYSYSLFTHLNPAIWRDWFKVLLNMLDKNGYLLITTRSPAFAKLKGDNLSEFSGISFAHKNETQGRLDTAIYGQTTVDRGYVESIAKLVGGNCYVDYFPGGGFDIFQDVHIFQKTE